MTPGAYLALARDIGIALALAFLVWKIYGAGENAVKVNDLKALQAQLQDNAAQEQKWRNDADAAQAQLQTDLADVHARIARQRDPIVLRVPVPPAAVPSLSAPPAGSAASGRGDDTAVGVDLRPQINAFETDLETALGQCRAVLASWPQ